MNTAMSEIVIERIVKPISPAPLSAACIGVTPVLDVARDVLDHHDRVVDDEADGDRQRHQRQVVEAVAEHVHDRERADRATAAPRPRDHRRPELPQEQEDDADDQRDREHAA